MDYKVIPLGLHGMKQTRISQLMKCKLRSYIDTHMYTVFKEDFQLGELISLLPVHNLSSHQIPFTNTVTLESLNNGPLLTFLAEILNCTHLNESH